MKDLHLHLSGATSPILLFEMISETGIKIKAKQYEQFVNTLLMEDSKVKNLDDYLDIIHTIDETQSSPRAVELSFYDSYKNAFLSGCKYLELRWNPYKNEPIKNATELCGLLRKIVNLAPDRFASCIEIMSGHPKVIIFYNFDYELESLIDMCAADGIEYAQWNGHKHQPIPEGDRWAYLVQYTAGAEGWNCIKTDTIIFFSQNYSYKVMVQAAGRIDRLNTPYKDLYYYHLKSPSSIDISIARALKQKKNFNERKFMDGGEKYD